MYNAILTRLADQFTIVGGQIILILSQSKTRTLMVNKIHTLDYRINVPAAMNMPEGAFSKNSKRAF